MQKGRGGPTVGPVGPGVREGLTHSKFRREAGRGGKDGTASTRARAGDAWFTQNTARRWCGPAPCKTRAEEQDGHKCRGPRGPPGQLGLLIRGRGAIPGLCAEKEHTETCISKWIPLTAHGERRCGGDRLEASVHAGGDHPAQSAGPHGVLRSPPAPRQPPQGVLKDQGCRTNQRPALLGFRPSAVVRGSDGLMGRIGHVQILHPQYSPTSVLSPSQLCAR